MDGALKQEIADEAKINKAILHYCYRSKKLLFEAVFKNAFSLFRCVPLKTEGAFHFFCWVTKVTDRHVFPVLLLYHQIKAQ